MAGTATEDVRSLERVLILIKGSMNPNNILSHLEGEGFSLRGVTYYNVSKCFYYPNQTQAWWDTPFSRTTLTPRQIVESLPGYQQYGHIFDWHYQRLPPINGREAILKANYDTRQLWDSYKPLLIHIFGTLCIAYNILHTTVEVMKQCHHPKKTQNMQLFWFDQLVELQGQSRFQIIGDKIDGMADGWRKDAAYYYLYEFSRKLNPHERITSAQQEWRNAVGEVLGAAIRGHIGEEGYDNELQRLGIDFKNLNGTGTTKENYVSVIERVLKEYGWNITYATEWEGKPPLLNKPEAYRPAFAKHIQRLCALTKGLWFL